MDRGIPRRGAVYLYFEYSGNVIQPHTFRCYVQECMLHRIIIIMQNPFPRISLSQEPLLSFFQNAYDQFIKIVIFLSPMVKQNHDGIRYYGGDTCYNDET